MGNSHNQDPQQMQAVLAAGLHVSGYRSRIVFRFHHDQAGAKDHQESDHMLLPGTAH
jgi:hypothetical protein